MYCLSNRCIFSIAFNKLFSYYNQKVYLKRVLHKCSKSGLGPPWKILFFGTDQFALQSLKSICSKYKTGTTVSALGVVSKPGSIVSRFAREETLPVHGWPLNVQKIESMYDIGVVVSFGNLIPLEVIEALPLGCINLHASLLPKWRGASPIIHSVLNGDSETGVTIMKILPHRFDIGDIMRQYRIAIDPNETSEDVERKLSDCGAKLLMECIRDFPRSLDMAVPQPPTGITYAPKIKKSISLVDWSQRKAIQVFNLHRAVRHLFPLTSSWHGAQVKLLDISLTKSSPLSSADLSPGSVVFAKGERKLLVVCSDLRTISVDKLTIRGKTMSPVDFYNGYMSKQSKNNWRFNSVE